MNKYLVEERPLYNGYQKLYRFPNEYGASVINHEYSYGLELAVVHWNGNKYDLCYDTPITDDVIGYLDEDELNSILNEIYRLEKQDD